MRLGDPGTGDALVLRPIAFEFPDAEDPFDADWLTVEGQVTAGDRGWTFREPCLLVAEAHRLAGWLRRPGDDILTFTEPLLEFWAEGDALRISLGYEALEPGEDPGTRVTLRVPLTADQRAAAAAEWVESLQPFPRRGA